MNAPVMTRTHFEQNTRQRYRDATLDLLTPRWKYAALLVGFLAIQAALLLLLRRPVVSFGLSLVTFAAFGWTVHQLSTYDREIRARANLTPVYDITVLHGQIHVLGTAIELLKMGFWEKIDNKPSSHLFRQGVEALSASLRPLLARGPTTVETARCAGYPAFPAIAHITAPGDTKDFITVHLTRIEDAYARLQELVESKGAIAETVSQLAGEFIPPLRAMEAQLFKPPHTAVENKLAA